MLGPPPTSVRSVRNWPTFRKRRPVELVPPNVVFPILVDGVIVVKMFPNIWNSRSPIFACALAARGPRNNVARTSTPIAVSRRRIRRLLMTPGLRWPGLQSPLLLGLLLDGLGHLLRRAAQRRRQRLGYLFWRHCF